VKYSHRSRIDAPARAVFEWYGRPGALERLMPPWESWRLIERTPGGIESGRTTVEVRIGPLRRRWVAQHFDYVPGTQFRDEQVEGPFRRWDHTHLVEPDNGGGCVASDEIEYSLPWPPVGLVAAGAVRKRIERGMRYRHAILASDVKRHRSAAAPAARIAVTGAGGLVGSALVPFLAGGGHTVVAIARAPRADSAGSPVSSTIVWNPGAGAADPNQADPNQANTNDPNTNDLEGLDAVVHLAGEGIAARRWSAAQKEEIRRSRVARTARLAEALAKLERPPKVLVCASAIGFYGDRADEPLDETSAPGGDYLASVCQEWEAAAAAAAKRGIRVVSLRFGIILTPKGGALAKMLLPFRMGAGGKVGSGEQWMSWVSIEDVVGAIHAALFDARARGPVNVVAPNPVRNAEFARILGRVLRRPAIAPLPSPAVQLAFGEMGTALLLSSQRVAPQRLRELGFGFAHAELEGALRFLLGRER
jgi:uncharacterized protein (TIGR01777 family)